jgi:thiamine transport system permease protein
MAQRVVAIIAALVVAGLVIGPVTAVLWRGGGFTALSAADLSALQFTVWQAFWSAVISVALAIPVARALARRSFWGRSALISIMGAPFILPVIVAILGLLAVFGGNGFVNLILEPLGVPKLDIYGAHGVILAHVFFNLPLAVRLILQGWLTIPSERFRVAASLAAPVFWLLEWPMLRRIVPGAFAVIFVICIGSFAVALTLGGGPKATTVELAIYQAFKFDFDLSKAASLAVVQLCLGLGAGLIALLLARGDMLGAGFDRVVQRWDGSRLLDAGLAGLFDLPLGIWGAALRSFLVSLGAVALTMALALPLATKAGEAASLLGLSVSGLVLGTGMFLIVQPYVQPSSVALPVTMLVNVLMALPFVLRILRPGVDSARVDFGRLGQSLGLRGWALWRIVYLPRLRRPMGFAAGLTGALAMGDLGVITLFSRPGEGTLPMAMYQLMGAYQMEAAYGAALLLVMLSLGLFWAFDKGGRAHAVV